jgi:hypothetical protein
LEFEEATDAMFPVAAWVVIAVLWAVVDDVVELLLPQPATTTTIVVAVAAVAMKLRDMRLRPPVGLPKFSLQQKHKEHLKRRDSIPESDNPQDLQGFTKALHRTRTVEPLTPSLRVK